MKKKPYKYKEGTMVRLHTGHDDALGSSDIGERSGWLWIVEDVGTECDKELGYGYMCRSLATGTRGTLFSLELTDAGPEDI